MGGQAGLWLRLQALKAAPAEEELPALVVARLGPQRRAAGLVLQAKLAALRLLARQQVLPAAAAGFAGRDRGALRAWAVRQAWQVAQLRAEARAVLAQAEAAMAPQLLVLQKVLLAAAAGFAGRGRGVLRARGPVRQAPVLPR